MMAVTDDRDSLMIVCSGHAFASGHVRDAWSYDIKVHHGFGHVAFGDGNVIYSGVFQPYLFLHAQNRLRCSR